MTSHARNKCSGRWGELSIFVDPETYVPIWRFQWVYTSDMTHRSRYVARMTDRNEQLDMESRKKRLVYRSNYRGFKEADLILGGFAKAYIDTMTDEEILLFEDLLGAKDHDIYAWITQTLPVPARFDTPLLKRLRAFKPVD